jgi:hypothetical protein
MICIIDDFDNRGRRVSADCVAIREAAPGGSQYRGTPHRARRTWLTELISMLGPAEIALGERAVLQKIGCRDRRLAIIELGASNLGDSSYRDASLI